MKCCLRESAGVDVVVEVEQRTTCIYLERYTFFFSSGRISGRTEREMGADVQCVCLLPQPEHYCHHWPLLWSKLFLTILSIQHATHQQLCYIYSRKENISLDQN